MIRNIIPVLLCVFLSTISCHQKHICPDCDEKAILKIEFNWNDIDVIPSPMKVFFYNTSGLLVDSFVTPSVGEIIDIDPGEYIIATYNYKASSLGWINQNSFSKIECQLSVSAQNEYEQYVSSVLSLSEIKYNMPDTILGTVLQKVVVTDLKSGIQIITLTPKLMVDSYNYIINGYKDVGSVTSITASLSGLAHCIYLDTIAKDFTPCIISFSDNESVDNKVTGNMLNFGNINSAENYLIISMDLNTGKSENYSFNVTEQIRKALNPKDITILIDIKDTITLPPKIKEDIDIGSDVDYWDTDTDIPIDL